MANAASENFRELPRFIEEAREEIARLRSLASIEKLKPSTLAEYDRRAKRLKEMRAAGEGLDIGQMVKRERYLWKAAGSHLLKTELRAAMREADKVWKAKGYASEGERWRAYREALGPIWKARDRLETWNGQPWAEKTGSERKREASHKKAPATDSQLSRFFQVVGESKYRAAFLVMEFAGARPEEFAAGVRVEVAKQGGAVGLRFAIEGAKCRDGHGQRLRSVFVPVPSGAGVEVGQRYAELAKMVKASGRAGLVVKVEGERPAGRLLTESVNYFARRLGPGPKLSAYSLRNRFSAQAKASLGTLEEVAQVLGHQSTETQKHYGRRQRGGGGVSPVAVQVGAGVEFEPVRSHGRSRSGPNVGNASRASPSASRKGPGPR